MLPKPGEDPIYDFQYVMKVFKDWRQPVENFQEAISRLEATIGWVYEEAKKINLDPSTLEIEAKKLKEEYRGDILPALNYLSQFTPVHSDTKPDYLKGVLWWALTAKEYCERNMKVSAELRKR